MAAPPFDTPTEFLQLLRKETREFGGIEIQRVKDWGLIPGAVIAEFWRRGYRLGVFEDRHGVTRLRLLKERRVTTRMNGRRYPQPQLFDAPREKRVKRRGFADSEQD